MSLVAFLTTSAVLCGAPSESCAQSMRGKSGKILTTLEIGTEFTLRGKSGKMSLNLAEEFAERSDLNSKNGKRLQTEFHADLQEDQVLSSKDDLSLQLDEASTRQLKLTVAAFKEFVDFGRKFGEKTASLPLGGDEQLHVSSDAIWYNFGSSSRKDVQFGPYLTSWQKVAVGDTRVGHYGVRLNVAW